MSTCTHSRRRKRHVHNLQATVVFAVACTAGAVVAIGVNRGIDRRCAQNGLPVAVARMANRTLPPATATLLPTVATVTSASLVQPESIKDSSTSRPAMQLVQFEKLLPNMPPYFTDDSPSIAVQPRAVPAGVREKTKLVAPTKETLKKETPKPERTEKRRPTCGLVVRISNETLLQRDDDYQLKVTCGDQTQLVVQNMKGRVIFNGAIDTPEQRSLMPMIVRSRVEQLERLLGKSTQHRDDQQFLEQTADVKPAAKPPEPDLDPSDLPGYQHHSAPATAPVEIGRLGVEPIQLR